MNPSDYPTKGLYCPSREAHQGRRERLLAALSDDSIFLHCNEHDWIRVELYKFGEKIDLNGVSAVATQVKPKEGHKVFFDLREKVPIHSRGKFSVKRRKWRENCI